MPGTPPPLSVRRLARVHPAAAPVLLAIVLALRATVAAGQAPGTGPARTPPAVVVLLASPPRAAGDVTTDTLGLARALIALLHAELSARGGVRAIPDSGVPALASASHGDALARARELGAAHVVIGDLSLHGDSVRIASRLARVRDSASRTLDTLTTSRDDVPTLVSELADMIADAVAPSIELRPGRMDTAPVRGGPIFPPPRPSVPFTVVTLYSKAVAARAAGDADTAARLLRQVVTAAPQWEQPKRDLAAMRPRP